MTGRDNVIHLRPRHRLDPAEVELDAPPPPEDLHEFEPPYEEDDLDRTSEEENR